ncbi:MAG: metallophosphoesterase [Phycisphaerales bacterium]|nr:metallophosphoesterase [Phycisphaerales bacterium]
MTQSFLEAESDFDERNADQVIQVLRSATTLIREDSRRQGSTVRLPARGNLLVTGDLHDNPRNYAQTVRLARLEESTDNHVVLHELIHGERTVNGMDLSYRMLVRVARLVGRHPGQVHPLLANHELSQMAGHPISKGAGEMTGQFDEGVDWIFGSEGHAVSTALSDFILAMPIALLASNGVFCSHSLPGPSQMTRFDAEVINRRLAESDYAPLLGSAWMMVWGRGQTTEQMESLAEQWGVSLFCLGHAFVEDGIQIGGPRTIYLNTDHDRATVLPISLAEAAPSVESAMFSAIALSAYGESV